MFDIRYSARIAAALVVAACMIAARPLMAAESGAQDREAKLIATLQNGSPAEKAITCKQLAIYGTANAVPALAALLPDPQLNSWARIALEAIPGAAADEALRNAIGTTQGRQLVGVINSVAFRHDAKAVDALIPKVTDANVDVASAAAAALGRIGGEAAAKALEQYLTSTPAAVHNAVAEGCVYCAESFLAAGNNERAVQLYDLVRKADVPKQRILEGTRGAILARKTGGVELMVEQLRSADPTMFNIGVRTAREMKDPAVTDALIGEMSKASADRQSVLIVALADRGDAKALPAVLEAAKSGQTSVRIMAAGALQRIGNASCVPVLLEAAAGAEADLALAAKAALQKLPGAEVDAQLLARLPQASGKARQVLIDLAEQRRIDGALAAIARCLEDANPAVRSSALDAIGAIGEEKQVSDLVKMIGKAQDAKERADIDKAIMTICGRWGTVCAKHLLPLAQSDDAAMRSTAIHTLTCAGGPDALAAVKAMAEDKDAGVQDEAIRTLSTWPNRWPEDTAVAEPLLNLAKSAQKNQHKVLALRGYLQYVQVAKKLSPDQRMASLQQAMPLITRPEERRLAISVLGNINSASALDSLVSMAADPAVSEEACSAIINLAGKDIQGVSKEQRQKALQTAIDKSQNPTTRRRAEQALRRVG